MHLRDIVTYLEGAAVTLMHYYSSQSSTGAEIQIMSRYMVFLMVCYMKPYRS